MKLVKNPEVNRLVKTFAACTAAFVVLAAALCFTGMRYFENTAAYYYASITGAVAEAYPDAEQEIVRQIVGADADAAAKGEAVLARYGIRAGDTLPDTALLQDSFRVNLALYLSLAVLACGTFTVLLLLFLHRQYGRIRAVTDYTRRINHGDYSLDIRDNSEGEISLLKNEIYKITTMLREQAGSLQKEKAALAESLADISHQLKTPMTSLLVLTDLLSGEPDAETRGVFLERNRSQLNRIEWLVSSLLTLSKLDAGAVVMKREKVAVRALVEKALQAVAIPLEIKTQRVEISGDDSAAFTGDFNWSAEALVNILKNCIEHTPENGRINIAFEENPLYTVIVVSDSGPGIDREDLPHIFNRFYRGKNAAADSVGIGLAMARAIVVKQGGDITVKSEAGAGTGFTLKFYKGTRH